MAKLFSSPWLKALSGLFINVSAAYFGFAFISPNVSFPKNFTEFFLLTANLLAGTIFLVLTVKIEEELEK